MEDSARKIARFLHNGKFSYGFVAGADKGLSPNEFVVVPYGSRKECDEMIDTIASPTAFGADVMECLISDAPQVTRMCHENGISEKLMPFIAANRAHAFACGWLTDESVVSASDDSAEVKEATYTAHPHIAEAADLGPQVSTLASFMTSVNFYNTNHNTGGQVLSAAFLRTLKGVLNITSLDGISDQMLTTATRLAGHASDKRITLKHLVNLGGRGEFVDVPSYRNNYMPMLDEWAKVRSSMQPAGTHIFSVLKETVTVVSKLGLGGMAPVPACVDLLEETAKDLDANGPLSHPGARYLFGSDPCGKYRTEEAKVLFGEVGAFLVASRRGKSITSARHLMELIAEHGTAVWKTAGREIAEGGFTDASDIKAALVVAGTSLASAVANPRESPQEYLEYNNKILDRLKAIK